MTNTFIIFTVLYCFLLSSIYGRTLTFFSMNDNVVVSPSPAPNADIDHAYVDFYGQASSPSHSHSHRHSHTHSHSHTHTHSHSHRHSAKYHPAPSPSHSHIAEYSPALSPSHSHYVEYSPAPSPSHVGSGSTSGLAPSPSHSHDVEYSPRPSPSHSHYAKYSPAASPSHSHIAEYSPALSPSHSHYAEYSPAPSPGSSSGQGANVYDVRSFGAVGDGSTDDTAAFKLAWDTACQVENGSAKIVAPRGFSFLLQPLIFTGPCKSELVFQVEGTIVPPDGPESWPEKISKKQWLIFYRTHGLIFQGSGLIDGRGEKWWNLPCKPHKGINGTTMPGPCDSPVAIRFFGSTNLTVRGIKFMNSPEFHIRFDACQNVHVDSLVIKSPGNSPNTDGIHVENTNDVTIYNSVISNGDDCISIGAGSHNLDIRNVTCGPSHGISIGSLGVHNSKACVSNITVTNCVIKHSDNGVRIKTWQGGSGSVSDITFDRIHMDTVRNPVMIDQYYCLSKNCSNQTSAVSIASVSYSNIKGTYDPRSPPVHLACSDSVPCTNITISGLELQPASGTGSLSTHKHESSEEPFCWNAYGSLGAFTVPPIYCLLEGLPLDVPGLDVGLC